jgi:hypothetical protein
MVRYREVIIHGVMDEADRTHLKRRIEANPDGAYMPGPTKAPRKWRRSHFVEISSDGERVVNYTVEVVREFASAR